MGRHGSALERPPPQISTVHQCAKRSVRPNRRTHSSSDAGFVPVWPCRIPAQVSVAREPCTEHIPGHAPSHSARTADRRRDLFPSRRSEFIPHVRRARGVRDRLWKPLMPAVAAPPSVTRPAASPERQERIPRPWSSRRREHVSEIVRRVARQSVRGPAGPTRSTTYSAIARLEVAAGDGALRTLVMPSL